MPILLFNRQLRPRSKRRRKRQSSHTLFRNAQEVWNRRNQSRRRKKLWRLCIDRTFRTIGRTDHCCSGRWHHHSCKTLLATRTVLGCTNPSWKNCWRQDLFKNHPGPTSTYCRHSLPRRKEKRAWRFGSQTRFGKRKPDYSQLDRPC